MEKIICEKCGREMMDLSHGPYVNVKCPHCGWGWATYDGQKDDKENPKIDMLLR